VPVVLIGLFTTMASRLSNHAGAKIQLLDLPGIIEGAKDGKGRGKQVIAGAPMMQHRIEWRTRIRTLKTEQIFAHFLAQELCLWVPTEFGKVSKKNWSFSRLEFLAYILIIFSSRFLILLITC